MPRTLGRYTMLETLGKGGFSKVRLGVDPTTGEHVALKILKKQSVGVTADVLKQVQREVQAMSQLKHPHVLALKEVQWECEYEKKNGTRLPVILLVLELATGGELFDFLSFTGPFEEAIARTYFQQMVSAISYCHEKGIAHRDIKPENLLLDSSFVLKVADWGFANTFNSVKNMMYTECGTPGYMAPELLTKKGYSAPAADIWSAAVVLFITLAGFPPFQRPTMQDWWFDKIAKGKHHLFWAAHERTAYFSDLVKDLLNKMLHPDPARRISMGELLQHPWVRGPTIAHSALFEELQHRKQSVEEAKGKDKAIKQAEKEDATQAGLLERGDVSMTRGEGSALLLDTSSDSLPTFAPSMLSFAKGAQPGLRVVGDHNGVDASVAPLQSAAAVMGDDAFAATSGEECESYEGDGWEQPTQDAIATTAATAAPRPAAAAPSTAAPSPPPFTGPVSTIQSFTRFTTSHFPAASDLYQHLHSTLLSLGCQLESSSPADFKLKAKCVSGQGVVRFSLSLYAQPDSKQTFVADFKRRSEDSEQFRIMFARIFQAMATYVDDVRTEEQS